MEQIEFIKKLYNGKNCYSDFMTKDQLNILRIDSHVDKLIDKFISNKIVFLTGNPGDGKTYIIRSHQESIDKYNVYVNTDINSLNDSEMDEFINKLVEIYNSDRGCIVAANEYPFLQLQKRMKSINLKMYNELNDCKKHNIIFGNNHYTCSKCIVIDLNERNLLTTDEGTGLDLGNLINKTANYLSSGDLSTLPRISNVIKFLRDSNVQSKIIYLLNYVAFTGNHFVVRDILGFISYLFLSTIIDENDKNYYDALFDNESENKILIELKKFDPVQITDPVLDEKLWNGEITDGWIFDKPDIIPANMESKIEAINKFISIKRKYYFENNNASPEKFVDKVYISILGMIKHPEKRENIESIILAINSLYLSNETEKNNLLIWTTNRYDISIDYRAAVCAKSVYKDKFELLVPQKDLWLEDYEFVPSYLIFRLKSDNDVYLKLDIDFLSNLLRIKDGYPVGLIEPHYEQLINGFMRKLENCDDSVEADEIIIANRRNNDKLKIKIDDNKIRFVR